MIAKIRIINTSITYENILDFNIEVILLGESNAKQEYESSWEASPLLPNNSVVLILPTKENEPLLKIAEV